MPLNLKYLKLTIWIIITRFAMKLFKYAHILEYNTLTLKCYVILTICYAIVCAKDHLVYLRLLKHSKLQL